MRKTAVVLSVFRLWGLPAFAGSLIVPVSILFPLAAAAAPSPRNVIFIVGDGMGPAHVTLMRELRGDRFNVGRMRLAALHSSASADHAVTDSAAGATAFASGVKANNRTLGIDAAGTPQPTVFEEAKKLGKAIGVVTTAKFFDATPAAFLAHVKSRYLYKEIIPQMLGSGAELIAGAGLEMSGQNEVPAIEPMAKEAGYAVVTSKEGLAADASPRTLVCLPSQAFEADHPDLPLAELTRWAIGRLKGDPDGFFLLVEHEGTDSSSHRNNSAALEASLQSLDRAVGIALDFAAAVGDTLVMLTGDHETGGLWLVEAEGQAKKLQGKFSSGDHTAVAIPLFAFGPGLDELPGVIENTEIGKALFRLLPAKP